VLNEFEGESKIEKIHAKRKKDIGCCACTCASVFN
jgi:hypothetical protein